MPGRGSLPAPQPLGSKEDEAVDDQERRGQQGGREQAADRFFECQAQDPGRDRAQDQQPVKFRVGVRRRDLAVADGTPETFEDLDPVPDEEKKQDDGRRQVGGDQERQECRGVLVKVPAKKPGKDDAVSEAGDREQLGDSLDETPRRYIFACPGNPGSRFRYRLRMWNFLPIHRLATNPALCRGWFLTGGHKNRQVRKNWTLEWA
jgi:hypothetical protein